MSKMTFEREKPYNDLPLLPPDTDIETKAILKKAIKANKALAALKGAGKSIPNQSVLISTFFLQEAKMSSEIENVITTNDELYQAFSSGKEPKDPQTKEVLHYNQALWYGYNEMKAKGILTTNMFVQIMNIIKQTDTSIRKHSGTKIATSSGRTIYTPPEGEDTIRKKLQNLEQFININEEEEIDPLIKMAVIHYQFEAIHPFADGNGRTGRILNILYLLMNQLIELPVLYLSKYIIENKDEYYRLLKEVTENGTWEEWILYMLDAIEKTALYTQEKIEMIYQLLEETVTKVQQELPHLYSKDLVELLFNQPYCKIKFLEEAGIAKRQTAAEYLNQLENAGILKSFKLGKEKLFLNTKFFSLLQA